MNLTLKQNIQNTQESLYIYHDSRPDSQVMTMESEIFSRQDGTKTQMTPIFWEDFAYAHFEKTKQEFEKRGSFSLEQEKYSNISKDENIDFQSKLDYYELHKKLDDLAKTYGISVKSISQNSDSVFKEIPSLNKDIKSQIILIESFGSKIKLGIHGSKDADNNLTVSVIKNNITKELPIDNAVLFLDDLQRNVIKMHEENINSIAFVAKKKFIGDGDSSDNLDDQFIIPHHETLKISGKSVIHETYLFNSSSKNGYNGHITSYKIDDNFWKKSVLPNIETIDHKPNNEILYLCDKYSNPNMVCIYNSRSQHLKEFEENLKSPKALNVILNDVSSNTDFKFNIKGKSIEVVDRRNLVVAHLEPSNNDYLIKSPLTKSSVESANTAAKKLIEIYHLKEKDNERVSKIINAER